MRAAPPTARARTKPLRVRRASVRSRRDAGLVEAGSLSVRRVSAPQASTARRRHVLPTLPALTARRWLLLLLAAVALCGAWVVFTERGAFFDEAIYLFAGRTLVFQGQNQSYESWFVGSPFAFPVLAGVIERLGGGLTAVRLANVAFLVAAVAAVDGIGRELRLPRTAALLGAAAFGLAGPVLFTGGFATYDMPALAATTAAIWLALHATGHERPRFRLLAAAGLLFGGALLIKYIVVALAPVMLALIVARLLPLERPWDRRGLGRWQPALLAAAAFAAPALAVDGAYIARFWAAMRLVVAYSGGHTTNYGATGIGVFVSLLIFLAPAWLLAVYGLERLQDDRRAWLGGVVLLAGSLVIPIYHVWRVDPLALFKQVTWSLALIAPLDGLALAALLGWRRRLFALAVALLALLAFYHVHTLQQFYPDTAPAAAWLQTHVRSTDGPLLVDDTWPYRLALANTFDRRERWVTDQWSWHGQLATPELWRNLLQDGTFSYVSFERGGAFNGKDSIFDASVIQTIEQSGRYRRVASFPSSVTWGNSILPPPFSGQLAAYSNVQTEIWQRID